MKSLEITNLDQHLKPLKIDDKTTPLEVSETEFRVNEKTTIEKSLEVKGDLDIIGDSSSVVFNKNVSLEARSNEDYLTVNATNILLNTASNYPTTVASVFLSAANGIDSQITFSEAGGSSWTIGNDAAESTATLSFVTGAALGSSQAMSLDSNGDLETTRDLKSGRDVVTSRHVQVAATNGVYFDGGTHTYIAETAADDLEIVVGGDTMATFDEANDRITMAATKHTSALANGTEFSATDSAYAGMILGYTRIANDSTTTSHNFTTIDSSSMTVLQTDQGTNFSIQFIVPPSGNVEIQCSFWVTALTGGAKFSLSTGTSYSELDEKHTYDGDQTFYIDESDHYVQNINFSVTGLTAGTDTTYYLAGLASEASVHIVHGRNRTLGTHYPPVIIRAVALPATITTGE